MHTHVWVYLQRSSPDPTSPSMMAAVMVALIATSSLVQLSPSSTLRSTFHSRAHVSMQRSVTYTRSTGDFAPVDVHLVEGLLRNRAALRRSKKYEAADEVLGELRALNVAVDDDAKQWAVVKRGDRRERSKRLQREREQRAEERASRQRKVTVRKDAAGGAPLDIGVKRKCSRVSCV